MDAKFEMVEKLVKLLTCGLAELKMEVNKLFFFLFVFMYFQNKDEILSFIAYCHSKQVEAVDDFAMDMFGKETSKKLFDCSDVTQLPYDLSFEISTALFSKSRNK